MFLFLIFVILSSCNKISKIDVNLKNKSSEVSRVYLQNNQLVIEGKNLSNIKTVKVKNSAPTPMDETFDIESKSATQIIANSRSNLSIALKFLTELVLINEANAASSFQINFSLCDTTLGGKAIDCSSAPLNNYVLGFDATSDKWKPRSFNGLHFVGVWSDAANLPTGMTDGEYYVAGLNSTSTTPSFMRGDWLVSNAGSIEIIQSASTELRLLSDVDLTTTAPSNGSVLTYDGSKWVPGTSGLGSETDPTVRSFAKANLPTCGAGEVLKGNGTSLSCVTVGSTFTGTASRVVTTDSMGALATSSVSTTALSYIANITSDVQTQLNAKEPAITAGTASQYLKGDKTLGTFASDVLAVALSGLSTATNSAISASDTVLSALGKLQAQITGISSSTTTSLAGKADLTNSSQTITAAAVTGLTAPMAGSDATNKTYVDSAVSVASTWTTSGSDIYRSSGSVGIGTSSPAATLHVNGTIQAPTINAINGGSINYWGGSATPYAASSSSLAEPSNGLAISSNNTAGDGRGSFFKATTRNTATTNQTAYFGAVSNTSGHSPDFVIGQQTGATAYQERMRIASNGNVGFGTSSPNTLLEVRKDSTVASDTILGLALTNGADPASYPFTGSQIQFRGISNKVMSSISTQWDAGISNNANITFRTRHNDTLIESMYLRFDGQIGIGTVIPLDKLDVNGSAIVRSKLRLKSSGVTNYVELMAPASLASTITLTLPSTVGTNGQTLTTNGAGVLTWTTPSTGFSGTANRAVITDGSGALSSSSVTSTELGYLSGVTSNLQTQLDAKEPAITAGSTAQYLRGDKSLATFVDDVLASVLTGLSTATDAAITASDSVLSAFGKLQAQLTSLSSNVSGKADLTNSSQTITAAAVTGLTAPMAGSDAANKTYVDSFWTVSSGNIYRSSGNVGIGTSSPSTPLAISGANGNLVTLTPGTGAQSDNGYININGRARYGYNNNNIVIDDNGTAKNFTLNQNNKNTMFSQASSNSVSFGAEGAVSKFSIAPIKYNAGTASQSGNTVTGTSTAWHSGMVGHYFLFAGGASGTITAVASATSLTLNTSQTLGAQNYSIHYPTMNVNSQGNAAFGVTSPATTSFFEVNGGTADTNVAAKHIYITGQTANTSTGASGGNIYLTSGNPSGGWASGNISLYTGSGNPGVVDIGSSKSSAYSNSSSTSPLPSYHLSISNGWSNDGNSAITSYIIRNAATNFQRAYFGAVSLNGAGVVTPALVWGQQTAAGYSESMRLNQNRYLGIWNTSPATQLHVGSSAIASATAVATFENADGVCSITPASSGSGIACSSDEELKENFVRVESQFALDKILKLNAFTYNFKTASPEQRRTGYIAQQVKKVAPEFVRKGENGYLQIYYDAFIPWITEAFKEVVNILNSFEKKLAFKADKSELEKLKKENEDLKKRVERLEKLIK